MISKKSHLLYLFVLKCPEESLSEVVNCYLYTLYCVLHQFFKALATYVWFKVVITVAVTSQFKWQHALLLYFDSLFVLREGRRSCCESIGYNKGIANGFS